MLNLNNRVMNKKYIAPSMFACTIVGQQMLAESLKIGGSGEKVNNSADIGFVKGDKGRDNYDVWKDDWNK